MAQYAINKSTPKTSISPWASLNVLITEVHLEKKKNEYSEEELKRLTTEKIEEIDADVEIYTDGSTSGEQENGGAGIFIQDRRRNIIHESGTAAGALCSSYDGECIAMLPATNWVARQPQTEKHYLILTDSQSLVNALQSNNWRDKHEWLRAVKRNLIINKAKSTICWIPSHCGTLGNERADELANDGAQLDQQGAPVTFGIIRAKIRNAKWTISHPRATETFGDKRKPMMNIEEEWPAETRRSFARLRSGHAKELKAYRKTINLEEDHL